MDTHLRGLLIVLTSVLITAAGCGGGGGSAPPATTPASTLSGTAAAGAPIIGTVSVKDSLGAVKTVVIAPDGKYSVDVSGMTAPFMLRAEGTVGSRSYQLHSAAVSADINGSVNITPLTDLIVANVSSEVAATLYGNGSFSGLTPAALAQAEANLRTRLQPVLTAIGLDATTDLLRATFNANHTGQDALLDVLRVTVDPVTAQATILNMINNQQIVDDLTTQTDLTVANATGVAAGLTDVQQIVALFDAWTALFATSLPSPTRPALLALFDPTFLFSGDSLQVLLADITQDPRFIGAKFTNVTLDSISANTAQARFVVTFGGRAIPVSWVVNKVNGTWLLAGDQRIVGVFASAFAEYGTLGTTYFPGITTGLSLDVGPGSSSPAMHYGVVTGAGLPTTSGGRDGVSAGVLLVQYGNGSLNPAQGPYVGPSTPRLTFGGTAIFASNVPLSDASINLIADNETYTFKVYADPNNTPTNFSDDVLLGTYTEVVGKRPYRSNELSAASFPAVSTTAAQVGAFAIAGGNLTVNWTLPLGLKADQVSAFRIDGADFQFTSADLPETATSANLTWLAPIFGVNTYNLKVNANDAFNRTLITRVGNL
jgi:hypothetical protein